MKLERSLATWAAIKPATVMLGSVAQTYHLADDAQHDIAALAASRAELVTALTERHDDIGRTFYLLLGSVVMLLIGYAFLKDR